MKHIVGKITTEKVEADYCSQCEELVPKITLKEDNSGDMVCKSCFQPTCMNCNEEVDEDGRYCSKSCYDEYWYDEDDRR